MSETRTPILTRVEARAAAGDVAYVTVNNPEKRNALDSAGKRALAEAIDELGGSERLRVLVVTGAGGKSFIGGSNLREMAELNPAEAAAFGTLTHECCDSLHRLPVPAIARIDGYCLGSGMEIAAACDMRVAADHSVFGMPEVRVGIPSAMEACLLPQLIGWGKTRELVFTGERIDAAEAERIGFLEKVAPAGKLDQAVEGWVASIVAAGPRVIHGQKALIRDWERMTIPEAVDAGIRSFADAFTTGEPKRMMLAFLEERERRKKKG